MSAAVVLDWPRRCMSVLPSRRAWALGESAFVMLGGADCAIEVARDGAANDAGGAPVAGR